MTRRRLAGLAATAAMALTAAPAAADTIYGVTDSNQLVAFDSASPGTVLGPVAVTGLGSDTIESIDFRPATLQLYALGSSGQLYRIDRLTGAATAIGAPLVDVAGAEDYAIDFNPTVDRLRIVGTDQDSLRVNPNTGALAMADTDLAYAGADTNAGDVPRIQGAAYTNNHPASGTYPAIPTTTLFDIDTSNDVLVSQTPPNMGTLNTIGALGVDVGDAVGFDIATAPDLSQVAYAAMRPVAGGNPSLYTINTTTGAATSVGALPTGDKVSDIAVAPPVPAFVVLGSGTPQNLFTLQADRPGALSAAVPVSGLQTGEKLLGIDTRPSDGTLYGLGSSSRLYTIDARTGVATSVNATAFTPALGSGTYGFDFNPSNTSAAIRLLSGTSNSALVAATGAHTAATALDYAVGDPNDAATPDVHSNAYTKLVTGPPATRLFDVDSSLDILAEQTNFGGGLLSTIGGLGVNVTETGGLEAVDRFDQLFAALEVATSGKSTLFNVNGSGLAGAAANGTVAAIGDIGLPSGVLAEGLALLTPTSGSAVPPVATPTPDYYGIPTATPTPTPDGTVPKAATKLSVSVKPKRDKRKPFKFTVRGRVRPVDAAGATCSGKVRIAVKRKRTTARVKSSCKFSKRVTFKNAKTLGKRKGKLTFAVKYLGSSTLKASKTVKRKVRYGRG